jgi:hypothetical protein
MKSFINLSIMALLLFSMCLGQSTTSALKESITLEEGTTHTFEIHQNEEYIGYCQYTVTKQDVYNEVDAYFIDSVVDLTTDSLTLHIDASYIVNTRGFCLHYEFTATVNEETHTMTADFLADAVHITAARPEAEYDKTIPLVPNTFSLDNNMMGQWDIVFSAAVLERGGVFAVSVFAAQPMDSTTISAAIAEDIASVKIGEKTWKCLKLTFAVPEGYTAYVTEDGQLIKMATESGLVITLSE